MTKLFGLNAEFFDIFGLVTFTFLFVIGILMIMGRELYSWVGYVILLIGILGLVIDGSIVIKTYKK